MNLLSLYENQIYNNSIQDSFSNELWGKIPKKYSDILELIQEKQKGRMKIENDEISTLKSIIKTNLVNFGSFTSNIKENLENWNENDPTFEIGHQPLFFGGGSFVLNKISYAIGLSQYLQSHHEFKTIPFLFIGDHDQVQNELTISRFPQFQSPSGLEIKTEYNKNFELTPMSNLPLYQESELISHFEKIRSNYRELFKYSKIKNEFRPLLEERLESSLDLIYESYLQSKNFSDWIGNFWAKLFIIKNKTSIFILKASDEHLRKLMLPYLEDLLTEENRLLFINSINHYYEKIVDGGYKPGLPIREENSVPFFYECPNCEYKSRIKLEKFYSKLQGKCTICNEEIIIEYNEKNPDLSDHFKNLSPRVETRSVVINRLLKTVLRVTGGGETTYHAQIIPYMTKKKMIAPVIMKTPRIYYNTPWSEKIASEITFNNLVPLQNPESFKLMSQISKSNDFEILKSAIHTTKQMLDETFESFKRNEVDYKQKLMEKKDKIQQQKLDLIQLYLSHTYGNFSPEKKIQEVSWNWIDLSLLTSLNQIYGFYHRRLKPDLPTAATFWLSLGKFN
jgi:uncharacterized protein YllA (UPF0747 family)